MLRNSTETTDPQYLQRAVDFVSAFIKGFNFQDALAIVRIDGIYVESFHIADVRQRIRVSHKFLFKHIFIVITNECLMNVN